ncbi:MAG: MATE family efflux transporter [Thermoplasmata archaeon]|nr:MATE family efflux transporter [Thermoplasmata archaeon]
MNSRLRRKIYSFAWPIILTNLFATIMMTVNMIMVGQLGPAAVAGVGLGGQVVQISFAVMMAVSAGTIAIVARYTGAKKPDMANRALKQSLLLGIILSIPITVIGWFFGSYFLGLFGAEPDVLDFGSIYVKITFLGTTFQFIEFLSAAALRGSGDMKTPLAIGILNNAVNIFLGYVLIFGHLGFPEMGVMGAAIGNVVSFIIGGVVYILLLLRGNLRLKLVRNHVIFDGSIMRRIMKIGTPAAAEQVLIQTGFLVYTFIIVYFGTEALAAHQIGMRIQGLAFMPGIGFSMAATALVGQYLGARKPKTAERSAIESAKLSASVMTVIGIVLFFLAEPMARLFISDPDTLGYTVLWIRLLALSMPAIGLFFTLSGGLRGAGDTRWPLYASTFGIYAIRLPVAAFLGFYLGLGIMGAWIAFITEYYVRSVIIIWRFRSGKWKTMKV